MPTRQRTIVRCTGDRESGQPAAGDRGPRPAHRNSQPIPVTRITARPWWRSDLVYPSGLAPTARRSGSSTRLHDESGAVFYYTGQDFRDLIQRFPNSPLVEVAAYALTFVEPRGECEGDLACVVDWD